MQIGVIGLGVMGSLVASSLVEAGYGVRAYDLDPDALDRASKAGAVPAGQPHEVMAAVEIVLLLLPGPPQIKAVVSGPDGLLQAAEPGKVIVDMSTVDPQTTRSLGQAAALQGVEYLDAPILGRPSALGNWVLPVGGETAVLDRCRPVLEILARELVHVGALGAGHTLKLLNALMFSAINAMTAEMMAIAEKAGLSQEVLFNTIAGSEAATVSGLFKEVGAKIVARDFEPIFPIDLLCKDNGLAVAMAKEFEAPPVLASVIQTVNEVGRSQGLGAQDTSALVRVYEQLWRRDVLDQS